jgi:DNA-binding SARP family transcriptional activator
VEFRLLGPVEVLEDGRPLPIGGAKERAILALLLVHANELVARERILDEIWGADAGEAATKSLRVRMSELRKALEGGAGAGELLERRRTGYVLHVDPMRFDVHRFERLVERGALALAQGSPEAASGALRDALELWRGPALADLVYEAFAQAPIARLEELRLAALELRIEADLALGRHTELVGELRSIVAEHPLRERARGQLMIALYRSGRQSEALEAYQEGRNLLVNELGLEPSPPLRSLEQAILRQDSALEAAMSGDQKRERSPHRSILVLLDDDGHDELLHLAEALAREPPRELILTRLVPDRDALPQAARALNATQKAIAERGLTARSAAFTSAAPADDLVRLAGEQDVDLLLAPLASSRLAGGVFDDESAALLVRAPCDVAFLVGETPRGPARAGSVFVLFGGSEHDWAAVELGAWLARNQSVRLTLVGRAADAPQRDASRTLARASLAVQRALGVVSEPLLVEDSAEILVLPDLASLIVGVPARWRREGLGAVRLRLAVGAAADVVLVRRGLRPGGLAPRETLTRFTWSIAPASA